MKDNKQPDMTGDEDQNLQGSTRHKVTVQHRTCLYRPRLCRLVEWPCGGTTATLSGLAYSRSFMIVFPLVPASALLLRLCVSVCCFWP